MVGENSIIYRTYMYLLLLIKKLHDTQTLDEAVNHSPPCHPKDASSACYLKSSHMTNVKAF